MTKANKSPLKVSRVKGFFSYNIFILLAFFVPAFLMGVAFLAARFAPFGDNMVLVIDSWHQYYPFLREFQMLLKSGEPVMYSWNTGGGSSFVGVVGNYLGSPLYLLTALLPSGHVWLQIYLTLTIVLRVGCAGCFGAIFLRKVFHRNDLSLVYFSCMFALCAFVQGYYWNMMWLDTFALLPLVSAGVIEVLRDKKFALYIVSLTLSVLFSFYIGYFVCIFVFLICICYTIVCFVSFKESLKNAGKMILYTAIAFMMTAALTIPVYMALSHSDSSAAVSSFPTEYTINYGYGAEDNGILQTLWAILRTFTNLLCYTHPIRVDQGLPNIACGVLSLVLGVFYIVSKQVKLKEKIVSLSLILFLVLSFVINQLNYIWHGMNTPAMVYYRFSFIFSFVLVVLAYRAFCLIDTFGKKTFFAAIILFAIYITAAAFTQNWKSVLITGVAGAVVIFGFALYRKKKLSRRVLSVLLCLLVISEMGLSAVVGVRTVGHSSRKNYPLEYVSVNKLVDVAEENSSDTELYRTEFIQPYTINDGALYSLYGISTFNSMCRSDYADFFTEFGLASSEINNRYVYWENTPVANLFLNIKYIIGREGQKAEDTTHLKEVATFDEATLYESTSYVPSGFMANKELLDVQLWEKSHLPVSTQNEMFSLATGIDKDVLLVQKPTEIKGIDDLETKVIGGMDYYQSIDLGKVKEDRTMTVEYELESDGSYYGMFFSTAEPKVQMNLNGEEKELNQEYVYIAALGDYKKGDKITADIGLGCDRLTHAVFYLMKIDEEVLSQGVEKLSENTLQLSEKTNNGLKGTIKADEAGLFYTSVLYDEGWKAYVDGKEVEITPVGSTFVAFELDEGEHEIELKFVTEGLYPGIAVSATGLVLFALLCVASVIYKKKKKPVCCERPDECVESADTDLALDEGLFEEDDEED